MCYDILEKLLCFRRCLCSMFVMGARVSDEFFSIQTIIVQRSNKQRWRAPNPALELISI